MPRRIGVSRLSRLRRLLGVRPRPRRRRRGRGIGSLLGKINRGLRKYRIISTVGNALGSVGVPYASRIGSAAGALGYGRRRRYRRRRGGCRR